MCYIKLPTITNFPHKTNKKLTRYRSAVTYESLAQMSASISSMSNLHISLFPFILSISVTQIIRLANEKGGRLSATPNWTMKALTATICARQCQDSGSTCQVFNYNHVTKQCHAYSKESVITEGRIMEKGWSLWKLSIIIF